MWSTDGIVNISTKDKAMYVDNEEGQDVLLFIDNIFHFTHAGSEVSTFLGHILSAIGYQPTLSTNMGGI